MNTTLYTIRPIKQDVDDDLHAYGDQVSLTAKRLDKQ